MKTGPRRREVDVRDSGEGLDRLRDTALRDALQERPAQARTGGALTLEGAVDGTLVRRDSLGDRLGDHSEELVELDRGELSQTIPVDVQPGEVDGVADKEGVDAEEEGPVELVASTDGIARLPREEQDGVEVVEVGGGHVFELANPLEHLREFTEDLLAGSEVLLTHLVLLLISTSRTCAVESEE
ncbi:hypothetical protein COV05_04435 [Candidatus Uhrbacteria bacterium CG10_big_fil_rev_8_21_14_0_10_48_16]|uniref:Uncharacterized protein n=1 Tax=Candidatus Uhrbacteria bacterium CG10_big_fil_rev_8_21_14_0_10_48_16 TaxID=1975038 RepID=A0A2M8LGP5_9BACT|nr:MAG: hypothetical protein COV05_04435 [Candidatus Uhrbacteria bacterium CG10_big_fil_rev_8_21_14_0_10_48_16]